MVDGADAGRQKQPFGRVHGQGGIEDRGARHHQFMAQHFLDLGARVGDARDGAEFAAGNRRRHADLAHRRRIHRRCDAFVDSNSFDILDGANVIGEAKLHGLGAVGDRAAAYRHDKIGIGRSGLLGGSNDGLTRRVRRHRIESSHATSAKCFSNFFDLGGLPVERAADHEKPAGSAQAVHLRDDRLGSGVAENHLVHGTENDTPPVHDACPPGTLWFVLVLKHNLAE